MTSADSSMIIVTCSTIPFIMFGGYLVNLNNIYVWLRWIQYISPIRYCNEILLRNEFENNDNYPNGEEFYESLGYDLGILP